MVSEYLSLYVLFRSAELLGNIFVVLFFTISVEVFVAYILDFRRKIEFLAIICINLITNPIMNCFLLAYRVGAPSLVEDPPIFMLESLVILVEWQLLVFVLRKNQLQMLLLSISMNLASYALGVLILGDII